MDAQTPFFGAKISLVSKSEIRYEGMLYTIDPKESTIALAKVRSFGTEDRPAERQVPPRDEIFEFIIFRASDIKDLVVDEAPNGGGPLPQQPAPFVDPAIVKSGQQPLSGMSSSSSGPSTSSQPQSSSQAKSNDANGQVPQVDSTKKPQPSQAPKPAWGGINQLNNAQQSHSQSQQNRNQSQQNRHNNQVRPPFDPQNRSNNFNNQQGGRGGFRLQGHPGQGFRGQQGFNQQGRFNNQRGGFNRGMNRGMGRGGFGGQRNGGYQIKFAPLPDGEFDFEKAHSDFQMLEEKLKSLKMNGDSAEDQELPPIEGIPASAITVSALEEEEIPKEPCYNKGKSFFDTISCEAIEREKGNVKRVDWKAERSQNKETFGVSSTRPNQRYFHNNNRRGGYGFNNRGGGGGYGRGRGGGGGGFRRYNNNNQNRQSSGNDEPNNDASPSVEATA